MTSRTPSSTSNGPTITPPAGDLTKRDPRNCGFTVIPKKVALVVGHGATAALALEAIAIELDRNHPNDALLSAVTVFYTDAHYEAEVAVRIEGDDDE